eukprot:1338638-Amorphochlora_amoeboformis.AAC.1
MSHTGAAAPGGPATEEVKKVTEGIQNMTTNNPSGIDPKDRDAKLTIQGLGADSTPYVSQVKSFRELGLKSSIVEALAGPVGWLRPSQIQGAVLRMLKDGTKKNIVAQAAFGSGKTGMFGLAMLNEVDEKLNALQCVCIAPARELATQIYKEITKYVPTHAYFVNNERSSLSFLSFPAL